MEKAMKEKTIKAWKALVEAYRDTVEYTGHGATGDPRKTIARALSDGVSFEDLRMALGVIAHIKERDERFEKSNRQWLYEGVGFDSEDWKLEYGRLMGDLDTIHPAHLDNLTTCLRQMEFTEIDAAGYGKALVDAGAEIVTAEKKGAVLARAAIPGEKTDVWTKNGNLESLETAKEDELILTRADDDGRPVVDEHGHVNSWKISRKTFEEKYDAEHPLETGVYKPAGGPQKFVKLAENVCFIAPWGSPQKIRKGGYLNITDPGDVYGIAEEEFKETYRVVG